MVPMEWHLLRVFLLIWCQIVVVVVVYRGRWYAVLHPQHGDYNTKTLDEHHGAEYHVKCTDLQQGAHQERTKEVTEEVHREELSQSLRAFFVLARVRDVAV